MKKICVVFLSIALFAAAIMMAAAEHEGFSYQTEPQAGAIDTEETADDADGAIVPACPNPAGDDKAPPVFEICDDIVPMPEKGETILSQPEEDEVGEDACSSEMLNEDMLPEANPQNSETPVVTQTIDGQDAECTNETGIPAMKEPFNEDSAGQYDGTRPVLGAGDVEIGIAMEPIKLMALEEGYRVEGDIRLTLNMHNTFLRSVRVSAKPVISAEAKALYEVLGIRVSCDTEELLLSAGQESNVLWIFPCQPDHVVLRDPFMIDAMGLSFDVSVSVEEVSL